MNSELTKWLSPTSALFIGLWLALMALGPSRMMRDPGTFWHTVVGEQTLQSGHVPHCDTFSFTHAGHPWVAQQWLAEIFMALIHRLAGLDGLLLATAALLSALFTWLAARLVKQGMPWPATLVLILLIIGASSYHFMPRPHLVTMVLMAVLFATLVDVENGRTSARRLWIIPPLFVAWTNCHGGALGGLATALFVLIAWVTLRGSKRPAFPPILLGATACLSILAVLANPYGPALPATWLGLMTSDVLPRLIIEHAPMKLLSVEAAMILTLAGIYAICLVRTWPGHRRVVWLVPLIWLVLTFTRIRHGPLFAITAAIAVADMWKLARGSLVREFLFTPISVGIRTRLRPLLIPAVATSFSLALQATGIRAPLFGAGRCNPDPACWPVNSVASLAKELERTPHARLFNDMIFGGYLVYSLPAAKVYIDDRCELYRDDALLRYVQLCRDPEFFEAITSYEGIDLALVIPATPLDTHLASTRRWKQLSAEPCANLYKRGA